MKKFDFYAQCTIVVLAAGMAISALFSGHGINIFFTLMLQGVLVVWQLISSAIIRFNSATAGINKLLQYYWMLTALLLLLLFAAFNLFGKDADAKVFVICIVMIGIGLCSLYYLYLYKTRFLAEKMG